MNRSLSTPRRTLLAGAALALAAAPASAVAVMYAATGNTPMAVVSESMEPAYSAGDLLLVRAVDPSTVQVGDVVTYSRPDRIPVTHRVTGVQGDFLTTKGDANETPDAPVAFDRVQSTVVGSVPYAGMLNAFFHKAGIDKAGQVVIAVLFAASASVLVLGTRRMAKGLAPVPGAGADVVELPARESAPRAA